MTRRCLLSQSDSRSYLTFVLYPQALDLWPGFCIVAISVRTRRLSSDLHCFLRAPYYYRTSRIHVSPSRYSSMSNSRVALSMGSYRFSKVLWEKIEGIVCWLPQCFRPVEMWRIHASSDRWISLQGFVPVGKCLRLLDCLRCARDQLALSSRYA